MPTVSVYFVVLAWLEISLTSPAVVSWSVMAVTVAAFIGFAGVIGKVMVSRGGGGVGWHLR